MTTPETVNLLDLAASSLAAAVEASSTIRELSGFDGTAGEKNARLKLDGTVVTDADFKAQGIIIKNIRRTAPNVRIVGEESPQETASHGDASSSSQEETDRIFDFARNEMYTRYKDAAASGDSAEGKDYVVDSSRVSVLVDPLDGTNCYANGEYDAVSILIAIILDNIPYFGVIGKPFGVKGYPSILNTGCMAVYGGQLLSGVFIAGGDKKSLTVGTTEGGKLPKAIISLPQKSEGIVRDFVDYLASHGVVDPEPIHASGAGEKSLRLVLSSENEGVWFLPKKGTSRWDVAASDALLRAMGGRLTDKYGKDLDYSVARTEAENVDGVIASNDGALHTECIRLFREGKWAERE